MSRKIGIYPHVQCEGNATREDYRIFKVKASTRKCDKDGEFRKCNGKCHVCPYGIKSN